MLKNASFGRQTLIFKENIIYNFILHFSFVANAQQKDRIMPKANAEYAENKFVEAEAMDFDSKFPNKATHLSI
jgi:hypothetical protein